MHRYAVWAGPSARVERPIASAGNQRVQICYSIAYAVRENALIKCVSLVCWPPLSSPADVCLFCSASRLISIRAEPSLVSSLIAMDWPARTSGKPPGSMLISSSLAKPWTVRFVHDNQLVRSDDALRRRSRSSRVFHAAITTYYIFR